MSECGLILKLAGLFVQASQGTNQFRDVIQTPSIVTPSLPPEMQIITDRLPSPPMSSVVGARGETRRSTLWSDRSRAKSAVTEDWPWQAEGQFEKSCSDS
jgi:hypothetical protein